MTNVPRFLRSWNKVQTIERGYGTVHVYEKKGKRQYFVEPLYGEQGYVATSLAEADSYSRVLKRTQPPGVRRMERSA